MASNLYDLDSIIDEKINQLIKANFDNIQPNRSKIAKVIIKFLDPKSKKDRKSILSITNPSGSSTGGGSTAVSAGGWFTSTSVPTNQNQILDEYTWEVWNISVECFPIEDLSIQDNNQGKSTSGNNRKDSTSRSTSTYSSDQINNPKIKQSIQSLEANLIDIYQIIELNIDNVPPITSTASIPYPYAIIIDQNKPDSITTTTSTTTSNQWWNS
ncbi:hypothetical protein DFJ63DRAFT_315769 [Scheffersomyces coipomensis]|uniref:uncharacterized protein n=1 Tax=Scheffersomyces coipomensis TaxID=1788519 RepID=UPI00315D77EA